MSYPRIRTHSAAAIRATRPIAVAPGQGLSGADVADWAVGVGSGSDGAAVGWFGLGV